MKNAFKKWLGAAMIGLIMGACGGAGGSNDPKSVTQRFVEAMELQDWDEVAKHATKDSKTMIDMLKGAMSLGEMVAKKQMDSLKAELKKRKIEYGEPVIDGDKATITVTRDGEPKEFKLRKEDGQWKVAFDKESQMQDAFKGIGDTMQEGADSMQDALKELENLDTEEVKEALNQAGDAIKQAGDAIKELPKQQ